jgi:hypothetical protein
MPLLYVVDLAAAKGGRLRILPSVFGSSNENRDLGLRMTQYPVKI